jgi:hypothetical protein
MMFIRLNNKLYNRLSLEAFNGLLGFLGFGPLMAFWAFGLLDFWAFGLLDFWAFGLLGFWAFGLLGFWAFGLLGFWAFGLLGFWAFGLLGFWTFGLLGFWAFALFFKKVPVQNVPCTSPGCWLLVCSITGVQTPDKVN